MSDHRSSTGRFSSDPRLRDPLLKQVIRARRTVDAGARGETTATGDPAKVALVERAKQWANGDAPGGPLPGGAA